MKGRVPVVAERVTGLAGSVDSPRLSGWLLHLNVIDAEAQGRVFAIAISRDRDLGAADVAPCAGSRSAIVAPERRALRLHQQERG